MAKTFPIRLEVEEIALGAVLRKLNDMPGIVKLDLDLGHGGNGAGKEKLQQHVEAKHNGGGSNEQIVVKLLLQGPKNIREIIEALGGKKSSAYSVTTTLRKQGLAEAGDGYGMHQLTAKARAQLEGALPALPAPEAKPAQAKHTQVQHTASGRAARGSGDIVLRSALEAGPVSPADLRRHMASNGVSPKSLQGVLGRAKKNGFIKKNGSGYEMTAKGQNELGAQGNG